MGSWVATDSLEIESTRLLSASIDLSCCSSVRYENIFSSWSPHCVYVDTQVLAHLHSDKGSQVVDQLSRIFMPGPAGRYRHQNFRWKTLCHFKKRAEHSQSSSPHIPSPQNIQHTTYTPYINNPMSLTKQQPSIPRQSSSPCSSSDEEDEGLSMTSPLASLPQLNPLTGLGELGVLMRTIEFASKVSCSEA